MESVTETKQGYKKTKIGWIPEDWNVKSISFVVDSVKSGISVNSDDRIKKNKEKGILKTSSVSNGVFIPDENKAIVSDIELQRAKLNPIKDALLISRMNTPDLVGACAYIPETRTDLFIPDRLWLTSIDTQLSYSQWLNFLLNSQQFRFYIKNRATGTSNSMKNISKESFLGIKIPLPPLPEQQKIAQILSTWDKATEQTQNLIEQLKNRKKGLMQQLLTGKTRLKGFSGEWEIVKGAELFSNHSNKNHDGTLEVLSATQDKGVIPRSETGIDIKYDKSSLTSYKKVEVGDYVISLRSFQGGIEYSNYEGLVSPAYTVLKEKMPISKAFYREFMKTRDFINRLNSIIYGIRDGKQISYKEFGTLKLLYPPLKEQKAIAKVLTTADKEIKTQETYLQQLQAQKKGLMQQLLTGQKRVKI